MSNYGIPHQCRLSCQRIHWPANMDRSRQYADDEGNLTWSSFSAGRALRDHTQFSQPGRDCDLGNMGLTLDEYISQQIWITAESTSHKDAWPTSFLMNVHHLPHYLLELWLARLITSDNTWWQRILDMIIIYCIPTCAGWDHDRFPQRGKIATSVLGEPNARREYIFRKIGSGQTTQQRKGMLDYHFLYANSIATTRFSQC